VRGGAVGRESERDQSERELSERNQRDECVCVRERETEGREEGIGPLVVSVCVKRGRGE
jgi:hypothetical protein